MLNVAQSGLLLLRFTHLELQFTLPLLYQLFASLLSQCHLNYVGLMYLMAEEKDSKYSYEALYEYLCHGAYPAAVDKKYKHGLRKT